MTISDDGRTVTKIYTRDVDSAGYLRIPDGVTTIGKVACASNQVRSKLKTLDLNGVEEIESYAFSSCVNLEKVIGAVKSVGVGTFSRCKNLGSFDFSKMERLDSLSFSESGLIEADIRNVEIIPTGAFMQNFNLERVICSPRVVKTHAFLHCEKLCDFNISNLEIIGVHPFYNSGMSASIIESEKLVNINTENLSASYARLWSGCSAYKISGVINEDKDAYVGSNGIPFILTEDSMVDECVKVDYSESKKQFLELWNN